MRLELSTLDALKTTLCAQIDAEAEALRAQYITLGAGQAMVYQQKLREAEMVVAPGADVAAAEAPNLAAEARDLNCSLFDAAVIVITHAHTWAQISAKIETRRLGYKRMVRAASTPSAARAAAIVDWTLDE